jgi:hypothetical protein
VRSCGFVILARLSGHGTKLRPPTSPHTGCECVFKSNSLIFSSLISSLIAILEKEGNVHFLIGSNITQTG